MTNDILPESVNKFLDVVEGTLCLPILLAIIIFTIQFIINHTLDIICTIISVRDGSIEDDFEIEEYNTPISARIRGMLCNMMWNLKPEESMMPQTDNSLTRPLSTSGINFNQVADESSLS